MRRVAPLFYILFMFNAAKLRAITPVVIHLCRYWYARRGQRHAESNRDCFFLVFDCFCVKNNSCVFVFTAAALENSTGGGGT